MKKKIPKSKSSNRPKISKNKKIKLKGSSFLDKRKPINKKSKNTSNKLSIKNIFSKHKPLNKRKKTTNRVYKSKSKPLTNVPKQDNGNRYIVDIIEKR